MLLAARGTLGLAVTGIRGLLLLSALADQGDPILAAQIEGGNWISHRISLGMSGERAAFGIQGKWMNHLAS